MLNCDPNGILKFANRQYKKYPSLNNKISRYIQNDYKVDSFISFILQLVS